MLICRILPLVLKCANSHFTQTFVEFKSEIQHTDEVGLKPVDVVREASHIDFVHEKRHMDVGGGGGGGWRL